MGRPANLLRLLCHAGYGKSATMETLTGSAAVMKRILALGVLVVALVGMPACFRKDVQTHVVSVPTMGGPVCAEMIQNEFNAVEGVVTVQCDIQARTVAVTYDSKKIARKNIEYLITGLGFEANSNAPNAEARAKLPAECQ